MQGLGCQCFMSVEHLLHKRSSYSSPPLPHHEYIMPNHAVLLCHACDTWPAPENVHFNLTASLYASSGHFPGSISPRRTITGKLKVNKTLG